MSRRKAFALRIEIEIHSVDSRDLKLCRSGNVALRVETLSSSAVTARAYPAFPIHFHERLLFEKVIRSASNLSQVQDRLNRESLKMELIHFEAVPKIIARFRTNLSNVAFPSCPGRIKLAMDSAGNFTGGTGPKVEVSTRISLEEGPTHFEPFAARTMVSDWAFKQKLTTEWTSNKSEESTRKKRGGGGNEEANGSPVRRAPFDRSTSFSDCSICNSYFCHFPPRPSLGSACPPPSHVNIRMNFEKQIPRRQLFYDSLDLFYRQLRERKNDRIHC